LPSRAILAAIAAFVMFAAGRSASAASAPAALLPTPLPSAGLARIPDFAADIASAKEMQRRGRANEAIALLEADHKIEPTNRDVIVALAQTYSYNGDQGRAIALLDELLKAAPDDVDARVFLAQAYSFNHDYAAAEGQFHSILTAAPADEDAQVGLAQTYTFEGRFADAKALFSQVLARDPKNFDALVGLAGAEGFAGDYQRARLDYRVVLDVQPDNTDALMGLATVEFWLNNIPAAIALDNRVLSLDPADSDARDLRKQLTIKTAPQVIASTTTSHSNDGSTFDYRLAERYYMAPTTSVGIVQELYQITSPDPTVGGVQAHRFGFVATYTGTNQFGVDLRLVGSKFGGAPQVTDSVLALSGARGGMAYGLGLSTGGVDGSIAANGGQTNTDAHQSPLVRINTIFANAGFTRHGSLVNLTTQSAYYNDGNRFHEFTADVSHVFGIGAYNSITPNIGIRRGGFSNTYNDPLVAFAPGYYNYVWQRDSTVSVTATRQMTDRFSAGLTGTLGWRNTAVLNYGTDPPSTVASGSLPFQRLDPYIDYEGERFSVTAAYYNDHYGGNDNVGVASFAANTLDLTFTIRLP
jgi:tetratricopeptide (TPR) repeat protein